MFGQKTTEGSLHPDLMEPLARLIALASRDTQLWITTHSERLAEHLEKTIGTEPVRLEKINGETWVARGINVELRIGSCEECRKSVQLRLKCSHSLRMLPMFAYLRIAATVCVGCMLNAGCAQPQPQSSARPDVVYEEIADGPMEELPTEAPPDESKPDKPTELTDDQKLDRAREQVQNLQNAVKSYYIHHDSLPDSLTELVEPHNGVPTFLSGTDQLIDPWGQAYQYQLRDAGMGQREPAVWTMSPDFVPVGDAPK